MYEFLTGRLVERHPGDAVLAVAGVGYRLLVSGATASRLGPEGSEQTLFVRHLVRDESFLLFGFASREERALFDQLCAVSKVGPATALALLSALEPQALSHAIDAGDLGLLSKVKGIGKRTAERLCVELRGRLGDTGGAFPGTVTDRGAAVVAALTALGYPRRDAAAAAALALDQDSDGAPLEQLVKAALAAGRAAPGRRE